MADNDTQRPIGDQRFHGSPVQPYFIDEMNTVTRFFPKQVNLTLPDHTQRKFPAGIQEVPAQLANDDWLLANGMIEYDRGQPLAAMLKQAGPGSQAHGRAIMDGGVYDATLVPDVRMTDAVIANALDFAKLAQAAVKVAQDNLDNTVAMYNTAKANYEDALARRDARNRLDPADVANDPSDKLTAAQRKSLLKEKAQNEAKLGLDKLSDEDRAKFEVLSPADKAQYIISSPEDRAKMLEGK